MCHCEAVGKPLAADRLISSTVDSQNLIPFTWQVFLLQL